MNKLLAITFIAASLAACSNMSGTRAMGAGNPAETRNSTDANKSGNPAAVSPGTGTGAGSSTPAGSGSGTGGAR